MKNKRYYPMCVLCTLIIMLVGCSSEYQQLVVIDGEAYTIADFHQQYAFTANEDSVKRMNKIDEFVNQMLVVTEAKKQGYDKDPVVAAAYETHSKNVVYNGYYEDNVLKKVKVTEEELQERYSKIIEQYHLAQIVVESDSLAQFIANDLKSGVPFESLVTHSIDTLSENGDIGFFSVIALPPEILSEVVQTPIGGATGAIKYGEFYYVLKVIEHKISDTPTYEKIKPYIENRIMQEKVEVVGREFLNEIWASAQIEYNPLGLEALVKPESLLAPQDLKMWVVMKIRDAETVYVYVNAIREAVLYQYSKSQVDPQQLIENVLVPDLIYDEAISKKYDKKPHVKIRLRNTMASLIYRKYYSDFVIDKVTVDSAEVAEYFKTVKNQFKDKTLSDVYPQVATRLRDEKTSMMRNNLFEKLREKYKPNINKIGVSKLLKEEV